MEQEEILIDIVEQALDDAFKNRRTFKMREWLVSNKCTKRTATMFIESGCAANLSSTVEDLNLLIEGGHPDVREAYPNLGKPEARKIKDYLYGILKDAWDYEKEKSTRRRRIRSK